MGLTACSSPSQIPLPEEIASDAMELQVADIKDLPGSETLVMAGDVLQIVRDIAPRVEPEENTRFQVRPDGGFSYLDAGTIVAVGRTPEQIADDISSRLAKIYRYPKVTVNIMSAPGNRVQVGGAVQNPVSIDITTPTSLDQAIVGAGGLLSTADASHVALLRLDATNRYKAYFTDFGQLLEIQAQRRPVMLKRGDIVFVPKSALGNAIEVVDLYMNQLLPFTKSIGLGASYSWTPANNNTTNAVNNSNGN
ncbi:polysaccharide export protein [Methylococcaceae bacterium WWC4]|nr:polysaccharide export protein [Methylococcaceae bacterium WWC4]